MRILLVSGSTRAGSVNTAVLRTAAALAAEAGHQVDWFAIDELPHFNPDLDRDPLPPAVHRLRGAVGAADAVLFCTPEYAGALPGSLKNLLDWTIGGGELSGTPVGWVNVSSSATGAEGAHASLRTVLRYADAHIVEDAAVHVPVTRAEVVAGQVTAAGPGAAIAAVLAALRGQVVEVRPSTPRREPGA